MKQKLRELIDRQEIWQVLLAYARGLDRLDVPLVRSCYFDDAIDDHGQFVGSPDNFIAYANEATRCFISQQHHLLNHWCEIDGDNAHAETYFLFIGVAAQPPHLLSTGRYIDHFQRRNGEWRIANRALVVEKNFDLPDCSIWPGIPAALASGDVQPSTRDRNDVSYHRPLRPRSPRTPMDDGWK